MTDPATTTEAPPSKEVAVRKGPSVPVKAGHVPRGIIPRDLAETAKLALVIFESGLQPESLDSVQKVAVAIMTGLEVGLPPMQAMKSIAVINGRPAIWGDAGVAIAANSGELKVHKEWFSGEINADGTFPDDFTAHILLKRKGGRSAEVAYSVADAKRAKLWGKTTKSGGTTPWITAPKRMLMWRARGFAFRDLFADALMGLRFAEEQRDDDPALDAFTVPRSGLAQRLPGPSSNGFSADHVDGEMNGETQEDDHSRSVKILDNLGKALAEATTPLELEAAREEFAEAIAHTEDVAVAATAATMVNDRRAEIEAAETSRKVKK